MISFVGAGPGAADLITLRGVDRLGKADVVIWAGSLVTPELLEHCNPNAVKHDSKGMTLEDVTAVFAANLDANIVRLHSGDPTVYSAIGEQIDWCNAHDREFEVVPGVSSFAATAAAIGCELTAPRVAQSVVLTRLAKRTAASVPDRESPAAYAAIGGTMAIFLSAARPEALQEELSQIGSAYDATTPAVLAAQVSRPNEKIAWTTVGTLGEDLKAFGHTATVMVLVGPALRPNDKCRSHVYLPGYETSFRTNQ